MLLVSGAISHRTQPRRDCRDACIPHLPTSCVSGIRWMLSPPADLVQLASAQWYCPSPRPPLSTSQVLSQHLPSPPPTVSNSIPSSPSPPAALISCPPPCNSPRPHLSTFTLPFHIYPPLCNQFCLGNTDVITCDAKTSALDSLQN